MSKKKLITSALPYVNNEPHLGNIIGCVLSADVFARYCRLKGYETLYICGNDEYGTATETKALEEGLTPRQICDKYHEIHKKIYDHFNIAFDYFGRTATEEHTQVVQKLFREIYDNGYLVPRETQQYYSESLGKFLADRLINGICPKCGYEDARGDQCDECGTLLVPTDLISPSCIIDGKPLTLKKTKNLFLDLPALSEKLHDFQESVIEKGFWTNNAATTTRSWMKRGLEQRAITRDLKWGVPVPEPGYENKVFYVWFDAPIGYLSIAKKALPESWEKWWKSPSDTELYQFMAKDNIPFHSVIFPAVQLAANEDWTKVYHLSSTEYLNYEDTKFSKSRHVGVFGTDVINSDIDVDLWRFYLLANRPEKNDASFCWQDFFDKINNEFLDNIGNLVNRTLVYCVKNFDGKLTAADYTTFQKDFISHVKDMERKVEESFEKVGLREALRTIMLIGKAGNKFFQDQEPWVKIKEDRNEVQATVNILVHLVKDIAIMFSPFIPNTSERIFNMLGVSGLPWKNLGNFEELLGKKLGEPKILFSKLDVKKVDEFKKKFDGAVRANPWDNIELKVGKVLEIGRHPNAEHLYVEKIDVGEEKPRTVVSGLVKHFRPEEILGKQVLVASNLKAVDLKGVLSDGMLLCASKKKKMEIVSTKDFTIGAIAHKENENPTPRNKKITIDEFKAAGIRTKDGILQCDETKLMVENKPLKTYIVLNSKIS